jgi:hypothetical protein
VASIEPVTSQDPTKQTCAIHEKNEHPDVPVKLLHAVIANRLDSSGVMDGTIMGFDEADCNAPRALDEQDGEQRCESKMPSALRSPELLVIASLSLLFSPNLHSQSLVSWQMDPPVIVPSSTGTAVNREGPVSRFRLVGTLRLRREQKTSPQSPGRGMLESLIVVVRRHLSFFVRKIFSA